MAFPPLEWSVIRVCIYAREIDQQVDISAVTFFDAVLPLMPELFRFCERQLLYVPIHLKRI
jgi:hypothetical protein